MPKLSLSRRHRRQSNLALLSNECDPEVNTLMSATAPRKVSDDDILRSGTATTKQDGSNIFSSAPARSSLKRPQQSVCLVALAGPQTVVTPSVPQTPRTSNVTMAEFDGSSADVLSPSSPWGHFVDMLLPSSSSSSDDDDCSLRSTSGRFVPSCPQHYLPMTTTTTTTTCSSGFADPYPTTGSFHRKRRRIHSPSLHSSSHHHHQDTEPPHQLEGFVLQFPEPDHLVHDLAGLSVDE
jgi:hypothetical protein